MSALLIPDPLTSLLATYRVEVQRYNDDEACDPRGWSDIYTMPSLPVPTTPEGAADALRQMMREEGSLSGFSEALIAAVLVYLDGLASGAGSPA